MINMCTVVHVSQNSAEKIWLVEIWADFFTESAESEKKLAETSIDGRANISF